MNTIRWRTINMIKFFDFFEIKSGFFRVNEFEEPLILELGVIAKHS